MSINEHPEEERKVMPEEEHLGLGGLLGEMVRVFLLAVVIIIPVRVFLFQPFFVQGSSMEPNFEDGEYLIISEFGYKQTKVGWDEKSFEVKPFKKIVRQDVAVFRFPKNTEEFFIKRIIGLPGESVEIRQGKVVIYNADYPDGYVLDESAYIGPGVLPQDMPKLKIGEGEYFAMGDNRMYSYDSRAFGPINKDKIIGRVMLRAWPIDRFSIY